MGKESTQFRLVVADLRGGRNGTDPPLSLREPVEAFQGSPRSGSGECADALNVDWYNASFARKRGGAIQIGLAFSAGGPFNAEISFLGRHVPGTDETAAELWAIDASAPPVVGRLVGATFPFWTAPALADNLTGNAWDVTGASMHGKYFLSYKSAVNRLHCWDGSTVRRTGMGAPTTIPTVADTGVGTYAPLQRLYRWRLTVQSGGVTVRRSEPMGNASFVPSGVGLAARVTRGALIGEGETHWELEANIDGISFWRIATLPIATTFFDDAIYPWNYQDVGTLSPALGTYALQKSYKFLAVDQNRVLGFGSWNLADPQNRVEFSAVTGSLGVGDEERVPLSNYLDLDETDSGYATGLVGPVFGAFYAFKYRQIWKLVPTGNSAQPYQVYPISKVIGAISHHSIKVAEDAAGNPMIYFLSVRGPYRLGTDGLEYIGRQNEDLWLGPTATVNLEATHVVAHTVYHTDKRQVWFYYAMNGANDPTMRLMYDVTRLAWARNDGASVEARCSVMFSNTLGPAMSRDLKPYIGWARASAPGAVLIACCDKGLDDFGEQVEGFIVTKPYALGGLGAYCTVGQGTIIAKKSAGPPGGVLTRIKQTLIRDFGAESRVSIAQLAPSPAIPDTHVQVMFDSGAMAGCWAIQIKIGDAATIAPGWQTAWTINAVTLNFTKDQAFV